MSEHVFHRLPLAAAEALDEGESARVSAHLQECALCASEETRWRGLAERLRELRDARPASDLVARTREAVEWSLAQRGERAWNRAALAFLVAFGWTLTATAWFFLDLLGRELAPRLGRSFGSGALWFAAYVVAGWIAAAAAASLLGRRAREQRARPEGGMV